MQSGFLLFERMLGLNCVYLLTAQLVNMRKQDPYKWQVAKTFRKIQAVANHKKVRNFKTDVIGLHILSAPCGLVKENAGLNPARFQRLKLVEHSRQCPACIEDVVHQQYIATAHIQSQLFG